MSFFVCFLFFFCVNLNKENHFQILLVQLKVWNTQTRTRTHSLIYRYVYWKKEETFVEKNWKSKTTTSTNDIDKRKVYHIRTARQSFLMHFMHNCTQCTYAQTLHVQRTHTYTHRHECQTHKYRKMKMKKTNERTEKQQFSVLFFRMT